VHGFAHLALDGQLQACQGNGGACGNEALLGLLLPQMLAHLPWLGDAAP